MINDDMADEEHTHQRNNQNGHHEQYIAYQDPYDPHQKHYYDQSPIDGIGQAQTQDCSAATFKTDGAQYDAQDQYPSGERPNFMKIKQTDKLQELKEKCFNRLNSKRKQLIQQRRQLQGLPVSNHTEQQSVSAFSTGKFDNIVNEMGVMTKQTKYVASHVDSQLLNDQDYIKQLFDAEKEAMDDELPQMTVEQWNQVYEEVVQDINAAIAKQLVEDRKHDESANFELNEAFTDLEIKMRAEILDPANRDSSVCAFCKHNTVRRIKKTKLICEKPGCITFDIHNAEVRVEDVMIRMNTLFDDHKNQAKQALSETQGDSAMSQPNQNFSKQGEKQCYEDMKHIRLSITKNSDCGEDLEFQELQDGEVSVDADNLTVFMECHKCGYFDMSNLI